ncbi:MAG: VC0807 family protein [Terriglobales bacterium]
MSEPSAPALLKGIAWSIALNMLVPVLLYQLSLRYVSPSEFTALVFATLFPVGESLWGVLRLRQLDPIAVMVLLGILVDAGALTLGGSPKLLLVRESFVTGAFGLTCFASLLLPRPLMFYFGRYFMAGTDRLRQARYNASWSVPEVRRGQRLVTLIWGIVFTAELALRLAFVAALSPAAVLVVSPLVLGILSIAVIAWSLAYAARMRQRVLPRLLAADQGPDQPPDQRLEAIQAPPVTTSP